jgi:hypothetical protein
MIGPALSVDGGVCGRLAVSSLGVCCEIRRRRSETDWRRSAGLMPSKSGLEAFDGTL